MKKAFKFIFAFIMIGVTAIVFSACSKKQDDSWKNDNKYDLSVPTLNQDGWYLVFEDDSEFDGSVDLN